MQAGRVLSRLPESVKAHAVDRGSGMPSFQASRARHITMPCIYQHLLQDLLGKHACLLLTSSWQALLFNLAKTR